nr:phage tail tape measure protein [Priestia megaterium]
MAKDIKVRLYSNSKQFNSEMSSISRQMKVAKSEFEASKTSVDNWGNQLKQSEAKLQYLNKNLSLQKQRVNELRKAYNDSAKNKSKDAKETQNLAVRLNNANAAMNKTKNQINQTTAKIKQMEAATKRSGMSMKQFGDRMNRAGNKMRGMGMSIGIVSGSAFFGLTRSLKGAYDATAEFEQGLSGVQAVSGATAEDMKLLDKQARDLGKSTRYSATQATEGMQKLALAGWNTQEIMAGMPGMLDLAASGNLDLARAADITSDTMQAFGLEAKNAGHAADVFAHAQANANTNVEQMGEYMEYVAPVANSLGWNLEESAAAAMKLADAGLKGGKAGQAFSTSLARLAKPTSAMKKEMKKLNMEFFDAEGSMKPLPDVMKEIEKGTKGMTKEQKSATLTTLFGAQAYKNWSILLDAGSESLETTTKELKNADGAAAEMAKTMQDNARGKVIEFQSAVEGLQISLTRHLMPAFTDIVEKGTDLIRGFTDMDESTQKTIAATAALSVAVLGVTTVVAGLTAAVGAFLSFAGPVGLAITAGTALLGGLGVALFAAKEHTKNLKEEQEKAQTEALRYGDNLSEGTLKGVKGYTDLYEGAKIKMLELRNMSGEEAEKTSAEVVKAFSEMADQVITELETQKSKLSNAINEVYAIAGDAGEESAKKLSNEVLKKFDKDIAEYKNALDTVKEAHDKYNNDLSKMPDDFAKAYQDALKVMEGGSAEFAKSQDELISIRKNISEKQDKILYEDAQGYVKKIKGSYDDSIKAANDWYKEKQKIFDQALTQGKIDQETYDNLMLGVQSRTNEMMAIASKEYENSTKELSNHLDERGKLIDIATGKEFKRKKEYIATATGYMHEMDENQNDYLERWKDHTAEVLKTTTDFSEKTKQEYIKDLQAFLESSGATKEEAAKQARETVNEILSELNKDNDKAKNAGKNKGLFHNEGLGSTKSLNEITAKDITTSLINQIKQGNPESKQAGKNKGTAHKDGLESTKKGNRSAGFSLSSIVSSALGKTDDGGGGSRAGSLFRQGLLNWKNNTFNAGNKVAGRGLAGLKSVSTSGAGSDFVSGFRGSINNGGDSVWSAAWSLGKSALGALKRSINSRSPSKETAKEGINFIDGFALSMDRNKKKAVKSAKMVGQESLTAFKKSMDKSNLDDTALLIDAAAGEIRARRDELVVRHEVVNTGFKEIDNLKDEVKVLSEYLRQLLQVQSRQLAVTSQQPVILNINDREIARAVRDPINEMNERQQRINRDFEGR